jgi:LysM repeat protein
MEELPYARYVLPALLVLLTFGSFLIIATNGGDQPAVRPLEVPGQAAPNAGNRKATSVTVKAGETASAIARRVRITVDRLRALNPGVELDALHPGQRLRFAR